MAELSVSRDGTTLNWKYGELSQLHVMYIGDRNSTPE